MPSFATRHLQGALWWVLVATVALTPLVFSRWTFDVFNITELTTLVIGVIVAAALRLATLLAGDKLRLPAMWPVVAFYLAAVGLTVLTSRAPIVSLLGNYGRLGGYVTTMAVAALAWLLWEQMAGRDDRQRVLVTAIVLSACAGSLYMGAQQLNIESIGWLQPNGIAPNHAPGLLGNSNFSGAHAAMGVGPAVWLAARSRGNVRLLWVGAVALNLAGTAVSQSRGAMLATAVTLLLAAALLQVQARRLALVAAAMVALTGVVALATSNNGVADLVDPTTSDERLSLWEVSMRGMPDHLWLGGGPDLYLVTFEDHAGPELAGIFADEPHNIFLDHLDGSGILGGAAWLALVGTVCVAATRGRRPESEPWMLLGVAYLMQGMVSIDAVPLLAWAWVAVAGVAASNAQPASAPADERVPVLVPLITLGVGAALIVGVLVPFRADMSYRRGIEASGRGDTITAQAQLVEATQRHPWESKYHARLGLEYWSVLDLRDPDQAELTRAPLVRALEIFPDQPSANVWLDGVDDQIAAVQE